MGTKLGDLRYRHKILSPAAYGIHHRIDKELRDYIAETYHHSTFFFHEFFLSQPIRFWDNLQEVLIKPSEVVAPFLTRVVHKTGFIPALNVGVVAELKANPTDLLRKLHNVPAAPKNMEKYGGELEVLNFQLGHTEMLKKLLEIWLTKDAKRYEDLTNWGDLLSKVLPLASTPQQDDIVCTAGILNRKYFSEEYLHKILALDDDSATLALLREYQLVLRPWFEASTDDEVGAGIVSVSISSRSLFWGECIILIPLLNSATSDEGLSGIRDIVVRNSGIPLCRS